MKLTLRAVTVVGLALLAAPLSAEAQQARKVPRIGYLSESTAEGDKSWVAAFRQGLRELGYVEGENIVVEQRNAAQQPERLPELAAELVGLRVDVFVIYGMQAVPVVKKAHSTIPIVMTVHPDPVGVGLVDSLARPGGNVTGLSDSHADLVAKRVQLLKEVVPSASRVAVLLNLATAHAVLQLKNVQAAAPALGVTVLPVPVRGPGDIERAFITMRKERPGGLLLIPDPSWALGQQGRIADLAIKSRLPAIGTVRNFVDAGLLTYFPHFATMIWRPFSAELQADAPAPSSAAAK